MPNNLNFADLPPMPVSGALVPPGYDMRVWRSMEKLAAPAGSVGADFSGVGGAETSPFYMARYSDTQVVIGPHRSEAWYPHFDAICAIDLIAGTSDVIPLEGRDILAITESCLVVYEVSGESGAWDVLPDTIASIAQYTPLMVLVGRVVFDAGKILWVSTFPHKSIEWVLRIAVEPTATATPTPTATGTGTATGTAPPPTATGTTQPTATQDPSCPTFGTWTFYKRQAIDGVYLDPPGAISPPFSEAGTAPLKAITGAGIEPTEDDMFYYMYSECTAGGTCAVKIDWQASGITDEATSQVEIYHMDGNDDYALGGQTSGNIIANDTGTLYIDCGGAGSPVTWVVGDYIRILIRCGVNPNGTIAVTSFQLLNCGGTECS